MAAAAAATVSAVPPPSGRKVPCEKCPLRAVECLREFTAKELEFVSNFKSGELNVEAGTSILLQSTNSAHLYTILSGWAFRYKTLPDGRRQILNYALPSDLIGLQGSVNDEMQHSVEALDRRDAVRVSAREAVGPLQQSIRRSPSTSPGSRRARSRCSTRDCSASAGAPRWSGWPICC